MSANVRKELPERCAKYAYSRLQGVVALYKPQGFSTTFLRQQFMRRLLMDLNRNYRLPPPLKQYFLVNGETAWRLAKPSPLREKPPVPKLNQAESNLQLILEDKSRKSLDVSDEKSDEFIQRSIELVQAAYRHPIAWNVEELPVRVEALSDDEKLGVVSMPSWSGHPLVTGFRFKQLRNALVNELEDDACGILLLALGHDDEYCSTKVDQLSGMTLKQDFQVIGEFGLATDDFTPRGTLREKSTYNHITKRAVEKVLRAFLRGQRKLASKQFKSGTNSEELFEELSGGSSPGSRLPVPDLFTHASCSALSVPHFELRLSGFRSDGSYCRRLCHEIGLELRSNAVTSKARLLQLGPFSIDDTLLVEQVSVYSVLQNIHRSHLLVKYDRPPNLKGKLLENKEAPQEAGQESRNEIEESDGQSTVSTTS